MRKGAKVALIAGGGIMTLGIIGGVTGTSGNTTHVDTKPPPITHSAPAKPGPATPKKKATSERVDLNYFKLDDRSAYGFNDVWVKWSVTNHSSKKSDYKIDWEAIGSNGQRVANSTEYEWAVLPGQTAIDAMPTTIPNGTAHLNVTVFDRTEAY